MEINNVTRYIDNKLSVERHKLNLLHIYNRSSSKDLNKSNVFVQRVLHNKKYSKLKVRAEENYYINQENFKMGLKIKDINNRVNHSIKVNPFASKTLFNINNNVDKIREIEQEKIVKDNYLLGLRIQAKQPHINSKKYEDDYFKNKNIIVHAKNFNLPKLHKIGNRLMDKSPIHQILMKTIHTSSSVSKRGKNEERDLLKTCSSIDRGSNNTGTVSVHGGFSKFSSLKKKLNESQNDKQVIKEVFYTNNNSIQDDKKLLTESNIDQYYATSPKKENSKGKGNNTGTKLNFDRFLSVNHKKNPSQY
eukprot:CAMPEP_0170515532 /NCGR_PEP_ID=MMETSP0209-20121228/1962_1 /TAXON_ID=665100 ORGANISM="Litonotus pictus, Strain P1" /NCGR_SAMPLE_ID=MMETSP0209 /ASSEMBLY_ACC=CAM_ASM_000301 /LENGTH=304 /DNA_ID=CAMNT_0010800069 /DNA_START=1 /DNA_END=915 /DNA_ORIENTATION=-